MIEETTSQSGPSESFGLRGRAPEWLLDAEVRLLPEMASRLAGQFFEMRNDLAEMISRAHSLSGRMEMIDQPIIVELARELVALARLSEELRDRHFGPTFSLRAHGLLEPESTGEEAHHE